MGEWPRPVLLCLIIFTSQLHGFPYPGDEELKEKREDDGNTPDPNIEVLQSLGATLNPEWLKEEPLLAQRLDRINLVSKVTG